MGNIGAILIGYLLTGAMIRGFMIAPLLPMIFRSVRRTAQGKEVPKDIMNSTDMSGKVAVVTGASAGVGVEVATQLARWGAHVIMACRTEEKAQKAIAEINAKKPKGSIEYMHLDLCDWNSVRDFGNKMDSRLTDNNDKLCYLVNNAGEMVFKYEVNKEGYERMFAGNHLGHHLLIKYLLPHLNKNEDARIVNTASMAWTYKPNFDFDKFAKVPESAFNTATSYGVSKACQIMCSRELQRQLYEMKSNCTVYSCHPGLVTSEFTRNASGPLRLGAYASRIFMKTPLSGAQTSLFLLAAPQATLQPGEYYTDCGYRFTSNELRDIKREKDVWTGSDKAIEAYSRTD
eukprot:GHVO01067555.1.p1 GENE.GHVO01067555.1~~GHVO01067555.1.p1  ORF type:complete len:375 (+),score=53.37 GHVO01067555.1:92-1126(+)